jgi:succinate dehydrogenase (ubiquinone) cytochrome b560 subunit
MQALGAGALQASFKTMVPVLSEAKTPIQVWGWEYLQRQKAMNRPIAPHLTVYKPMLTWMVSGLHRISGTVMGVAIALMSVSLMAAPFDFPAVIEFIRNLGLPEVVKAAVRFIIAWPIVFHMLNGVRFLGFDLAKGIEIRQVYKTGWTVVALSIIIAGGLALWRGSA